MVTITSCLSNSNAHRRLLRYVICIVGICIVRIAGAIISYAKYGYVCTYGYQTDAVMVFTIGKSVTKMTNRITVHSFPIVWIVK